MATLLALTIGVAERLSLNVDERTGHYNVSIDGALWFTSGPIAYTRGNQMQSTADSTLSLRSYSTGQGSDILGEYDATTIEWVAKGIALSEFTTTFKRYRQAVAEDTVAEAIVFEQRFAHGVHGTALNASDPYSSRDEVSSMFPSLKLEADLGYLAFAGAMTGSEYVHGRDPEAIPSGVKGTGPVCFFDSQLKAAAVLSPYSEFMAASSAHVGAHLAYGVQGSIGEYPADYAVSFILSIAAHAPHVGAPRGGVRAAFEVWGDVLLATYGKSRAVSYADYGLRYLSYSTDNGAYYYYHTEGDPPGPPRGPPYRGNVSYEQTLIDVRAHADAQRLPYRYVLLDSWWYFQGKRGGVANWVGRPDVFPHGNGYVRNATGWPIMGHNRWWAVDNVYAKANGGAYDFVLERAGEGVRFDDFALPTEQRFWDDLMANASRWGLFMYEQDWLYTEYNHLVHLNTDARAARTWLRQMGAAAARHGITIQYCMSYPRHILQSVEIQAVTNARASDDYHPGNDQWRPLGTTSLLAWALALAPTKDNYWSTDVQTGSGYDDHATIREPYNRLQAAVSTLSKGPVAPADKIGRSDVALILKSCAADGTLLQGDQPATAIDAQHVRAAFGCRGARGESHRGVEQCGPAGEVWATHSRVGGARAPPHAVVLAANLSSPYELTLADLPELATAEGWQAQAGQAQGRQAQGHARKGHARNVQAAEGKAAQGQADACYVAYEANTTSSLLRIGGGAPRTSLTLHAPGMWEFELWALAPCHRGISLVGEQDKWVPVSSARFARLTYSFAKEASVPEPVAWRAAVDAAGAVGEVLRVTWAWVGDPIEGHARRLVMECQVSSTGTAHLEVATRGKKQQPANETFAAFCNGEPVPLS